MGKLKILSGKEVRQILQVHGFKEVRRKGSHAIMQKNILGSTISVPVPDHKQLKAGTLMAIIRQSGIHRSAFE